MVETISFMNEAVKKSGDLYSANAKLAKMLEGYTLDGKVAILPDFTDSNSLPIGTTAIVKGDRAINPALVGMDIGCGYQLLAANLKPKRFIKKGKLRENAAQLIVDAIHQGIYGNGRAGHTELGTVGKGNHFIDMFAPEQIYDSAVCQQNGIDEEKVYFLIHSGSRNKGFEVNSAFSEIFRNLNGNYATFNEDYMKAFSEARSYARLNRDMLAKIISESLNQIHGEEIPTSLIFDKPHNDIQTVEDKEGFYKIKKGTSSLKVGEVFVIPGTAVDSAYLVIGMPGLENSHFTINHGCGRRYTREQTLNKYQRADLEKDFSSVVLNVEPKRMVEEHPNAYKSIDDVTDSLESFGLARRIAKLRPVGIIVERKQEYRK